MPRKKAKSREANAELPDPTSEFPFRVGDEVEMKSFETGYRGAWFRVQIMKIRLDRKSNILCMMLYKDYSDESQEEISGFERDPVSGELILMVRPLPPTLVKESKFNKSVHTKMCVVYRDEWEVGDLVDWWYHHCWWTAKVISNVGDGRFQLVCPAPPAGEGGVYLANSRDLRPSLKWSMEGHWSAPPSKEIGKIPCARIVWLLDRDEAAEFSVPNQDKMLLAKSWVSTVGDLMRRPLSSQEAAEFAFSNKDKEVPKKKERAKKGKGQDEVPKKRGRHKKVKGQEEVTKKRSWPMVIKIIHPREDTGHEKVNHVLIKQSENGNTEPAEQESEAEIRPKDESEVARARIEIQPEVESRESVNHAVAVMVKQSENGEVPGSNQKTAVIATQILEVESQNTKQKRAVAHAPDKAKVPPDNVSNGPFEEGKRQKLDHNEALDWEGKGEDELNVDVEDQCLDGKKRRKSRKDLKELGAGKRSLRDGLRLGPSKSGNKHSIQENKENKVAVKPTLMSSVVDGLAGHLPDLAPREEITLPSLDTDKDMGVDQISLHPCTDEVQVSSFNLLSSSAHMESVTPEKNFKVQAHKEALDLKVLNAYEEAFTKDTCSDGKRSSSMDNPLFINAFKDAHMEDICPEARNLVRGEICAAGRRPGLAQDLSPFKRKLGVEIPVPVRHRKAKNVTKDTIRCDGGSFLDTKSSTLQDRDLEKADNVRPVMQHELVIGEEASSFDTISIGGSLDSSSGHMANINAEEGLKDDASSHDVASLGVEEDSVSSSVLGSSLDKHSTKSASFGLTTSADVFIKTEKADKNDLSLSLRKKIPKPVIKHKVSLSRKLIDQARRELSAKRRRSYGSTQRC